MKLLTVILGTFFMINPLTATLVAGQDTNLHSTLIENLKNRDQQIKKLLDGHEGSQITGEKKEQLIDLINNTIDFKEMGKLALADEINSFSEAELTEFYQLFSTMIRQNSVKNLDIYKASIQYEGVREETNGHLIVQTVSSLDNVSTPVYYTYVNTNEGWVVADFAIDNASTAMSYQRSFSRLISKRGVEGLLKVLRKKAEPSK